MDYNGLYKSADGAALRFYEQAAKNTFQSEKNGRPIYDQVLYVEVITPGSKESSPVFELERKFSEEANISEPLRTQQYDKFREQIKAFRGDTESGDMRGTPLTAWPAIDSATAATLAEGRVYTVEALSLLPDDKLRILGPQGRTLRERAQVFLNAAAGNAQVEGMASEMQNMREDMDRMRQELAEANARAERAVAAAQAGAPYQEGGNPSDQGGDSGKPAGEGGGASGEGRMTGQDTARAPNSSQRAAADPAAAGQVKGVAPASQNPSAPAPAGTTQTQANPQGGNALPPII